MINRSTASPIAILLAATTLAAGLLAGCSPITGGPSTPAYQTYLYMTDTYAGKVYAYDPATHAPLPSSLAATGISGSGAIAFFKGIGYVAVGYGTGEGVYRFDPSATNPAFTKIGSAVAAQYFAFYGPTKAYVSTYGNGLYSFDPSSPASGISASPVAGTAGLTLQGLLLGDDGFIYAADNGNGAVLRIDPSSDTLVATIKASSGGTTGVAKGLLNGVAGVFVANTGGYDPVSYNPKPGSIDFIASGAGAASMVTSGGSLSIYPAALAQVQGGALVATGFDHSYLVTLSGAAATVSELIAGGASFGGYDIAYKDGLAYIPVGTLATKTSQLFVVDATGAQQAYSPVSVMETGTDMITNIGFYE
jgi:hypothetical protein